MADINLKGMGVALITPFKEDESVDYEALGKLVDYQVQNGTDYLVVLGTTAETPTLTEEEKKNIISLVVTRVRGRIPIVLGVGGNCTRSVVEKLKTDNFEGIDAILSVAPEVKATHIRTIVPGFSPSYTILNGARRYSLLGEKTSLLKVTILGTPVEEGGGSDSESPDEI